MRDRETKTHPSYGLIRFCRVNGSRDFFASESKPQSYIELTVKEAEVESELSNKWYYGRKQLIRLRLTNNQFAELITSLNMGDGVPCTLEFANGANVEQEKDREYTVDFHKRSIRDRFTNMLSLFKERGKSLKSISEKLPKKDQEEFGRFIDFFVQEFESNMPFFIECFHEQMEKVAQEIKSNLEADVLHKLTSIGLESFKQNQLSEKL